MGGLKLFHTHLDATLLSRSSPSSAENGTEIALNLTPMHARCRARSLQTAVWASEADDKDEAVDNLWDAISLISQIPLWQPNQALSQCMPTLAALGPKLRVTDTSHLQAYIKQPEATPSSNITHRPEAASLQIVKSTRKFPGDFCKALT